MPRAQQRHAGRTLAFVGDTRHHVDDLGRLCTHAALAAQLDLWARRFDRVVFCGVRAAGPPPASFAPYANPGVELVPLHPAGGPGWRAKLGLLTAVFSWIRVLTPLMREADAVHLRTPCNVTLVGIPLARALCRRRYAIYAGSWHPYRDEALSYRVQRWMLRRIFRGVVHAYVDEGSAANGIRPAFSPVLSNAALTEVAALRDRRSEVGRPGVDRPLRVVSVGRFSTNKNQIALIEAIREVMADGFDVEAKLIGDGPTRGATEAAASGLDGVEFVSVASRSQVFEVMAWADLNVLPSFHEGYPKVLLEGVSAGALPVAADRPMNRSIAHARGWVFDPSKPHELSGVLRAAVDLDHDEWRQRRESCGGYARAHTLDAFGMEIDHIVEDIWGFVVDPSVVGEDLRGEDRSADPPT